MNCETCHLPTTAEITNTKTFILFVATHGHILFLSMFFITSILYDVFYEMGVIPSLFFVYFSASTILSLTIMNIKAVYSSAISGWKIFSLILSGFAGVFINWTVEQYKFVDVFNFIRGLF